MALLRDHIEMYKEDKDIGVQKCQRAVSQQPKNKRSGIVSCQNHAYNLNKS